MKRVEYLRLTRSDVLLPGLGFSGTARTGGPFTPFWREGGSAVPWLENCFGALIGGRRDDFFWRSEKPLPLSSILCSSSRVSRTVVEAQLVCGSKVPMVPPVRRMRKSFRSLALNCFKPRSKIYKVYYHQCAPQFNPRKISLFLLRSENVIFDKSVYSCTCICRCSRYRFPRYVIHPPVLQSMLPYICYYSSVKPYGKLNFSNICSNQHTRSTSIISGGQILNSGKLWKGSQRRRHAPQKKKLRCKGLSRGRRSRPL